MRSDLLEPWRPGAAGEGPWDRSAAFHLLVRAGFGPAPGEVERALDEGLEATLQRLFDPPGHDPFLHGSAAHLLAGGSLELLQGWWMALVLGGGDPLRERAALLWHGHFATSHDKVGDVRLMHRQNELFRGKGLGDFRDLLHAVATDPAMLLWLDGDENRRGHPNENFARELFELFALGIGHYSERDVQEAARAFTGWGTEGRSFAVRAERHDPGPKTVLGRTGRFDGEAVIEIVLDHPACARHVARRLVSELVSPEPGEEAVEALAAELTAQGWHVGRTLEVLLRSRLFFSAAARRSRISGPVELVARAVRGLGARIAPVEAARAAARMGQSLLRPPSVKGWDGGRAWIHAQSWIARHDFLAGLAAAHLEPRKGVEVDLAKSMGRPRSIAGAASAAAGTLLAEPPSPAYLGALEAGVAGADSIDEALARAAALVLTSPEYHLS